TDVRPVRIAYRFQPRFRLDFRVYRRAADVLERDLALPQGLILLATADHGLAHAARESQLAVLGDDKVGRKVLLVLLGSAGVPFPLTVTCAILCKRRCGDKRELQ